MPTSNMIGSYESPHKTRRINVGLEERWISAVSGGLLMAYGLKRFDTAGAILAAAGAGLAYRGATGHCYTYQSLGINTAGETRSLGTSVPYELGIRVDRAVTINKPARELFQFWRNLENLATFMGHVDSVRRLDDTRSHWVVRGPAGRTVEWDAEIVNEVEDQLIGWRSLEGADVDSAGSVRFQELSNGRGTEVRVSLQYNPPGGKLGKWLAMAFGEEPGQQITEDLRRFKQLMEAGEVPTTEGQPAGASRNTIIRQTDEFYRKPEEASEPAIDRNLPPADEVQEASEESFPASDAPARY